MEPVLVKSCGPGLLAGVGQHWPAVGSSKAIEGQTCSDVTLEHRGHGMRYLHPEEGDAGQQVHSGLQVLKSLTAAGGKVFLVK